MSNEHTPPPTSTKYIKRPDKRVKVSAFSRFNGQVVTFAEQQSAMNGVIRLMHQRFGIDIMNKVLWTEPTRFLQAKDELENTKCLGWRTNHIVGIKEHLYKTGLARALNATYGRFGESLFFPITSEIYSNGDLLQWLAECKEEKNHQKKYIIKPGIGHQGDNIIIAPTYDDVKQGALQILREHPRRGGIVIQEYIERPMLIHGKKFDFRIYVLIDSIAPIYRFHIFREGLVRFCTETYSDSQHNPMVHLTNYSLNKQSQNFIQAQTNLVPATMHTKLESKRELVDDAYLVASKRSISLTLNQLRMNPDEFWSCADNVIDKTLLSFYNPLKNSYNTFTTEMKENKKRNCPCKSEQGYETCQYNMDTNKQQICFQMIGIDILMTEKRELKLIEVNNNPSFLCKKCSLDSVIKQGVMNSTMSILNLVEEDSVDAWFTPYRTIEHKFDENYII